MQALVQAVAPEADRQPTSTHDMADKQAITLSEDDCTSSGEALLERSV